MSDNADWLAFLAPLKTAIAFVGTASGSVIVGWGIQWLVGRGKAKSDSAVREDQKIQHALERLDDRQRAEFDRMDAKVVRLETENERVKAENDGLHRLVWVLRGRVYDAQQVAESAARLAGEPRPQWDPLPQLENKR